jgi:2-polyprenyl-6-methoxyphenol hydroxylase-like FAD-dependent oxidoreductase
MADVVMVGGGFVGLCAAMMLGRDGHHVTVVERDPAPPPPNATEAWDAWDRRGVNQFRLLHFLLARARAVADAELPGLTDALLDEGALRFDSMAGLPEAITGGTRADDDRFVTITGRRPMIEAVVARVAASAPGVEIRRGHAVSGLRSEPGADGIPHVTGVVLDDGTALDADLVVDATGRRSPLPRWLAGIGARPLPETIEDSGFLYYGRHFRSGDGSVPPPFGPPLQHYDSLSLLTLPADNGTWGVGIVTSAKDIALRVARDVDTWERIVRSYPLVAHWIDGEPLGDVAVMAKIEDRTRQFCPDGVPLATGIVPLADSWACTNPSLGRGISIGLMHAGCLRDAGREPGFGDAREFAQRWDELTTERVDPYLRETVAFDRHRLAEIDAQIAGTVYETDDESWLLGVALDANAARDPDILRARVATGHLLATMADVEALPGVRERLVSLGSPEAMPGPTRKELVALL